MYISIYMYIHKNVYLSIHVFIYVFTSLILFLFMHLLIYATDSIQQFGGRYSERLGYSYSLCKKLCNGEPVGAT